MVLSPFLLSRIPRSSPMCDVAPDFFFPPPLSPSPPTSSAIVQRFFLFPSFFEPPPQSRGPLFPVSASLPLVTTGDLTPVCPFYIPMRRGPVFPIVSWERCPLFKLLFSLILFHLICVWWRVFYFSPPTCPFPSLPFFGPPKLSSSHDVGLR